MAEIKIKTTDGNNAVTLAGPASGADVTLKLPTAAGSAGQYLKTDGSNGQLSFDTVAVGGATGTDYNDNVKVRLGTGNDLEIFHDGSNSYLKNSTGNIAIEAKAGEMSVKCIPDAAVELYHNDTKQCETSATGLAFPSGKGLDFSASGNETNKESELLADYETGWFTPTCSSSITLVAGDSRLWYVKIGQVVHISGGLRVNDGQSQAKLEFSGLPFTHGAMGSNGSNKSTGPFTCWGWSDLPSYMDDDRHTWWMVSGTDLYLRTRQSNGDWHYFYPSDNCFIHFNITYHTDS